MKVILAGGSGLLGRALAEKLIAAGDQVIILTRRPQKVSLPAGAEAAAWDGQTPEGWQHLVDEADAVVNLAGENLGKGRWTNERKKLFASSRVDPGQAIVAAISGAKKKPSVVLQASAVGYYGKSGDRILDENEPPGSDYFSQLCVQWEDATRPVESMGVRRAVFRTGIVLAQGGEILDKFLLQFRLFGG